MTSTNRVSRLSAKHIRGLFPSGDTSTSTTGRCWRRRLTLVDVYGAVAAGESGRTRARERLQVLARLAGCAVRARRLPLTRIQRLLARVARERQRTHAHEGGDAVDADAVVCARIARQTLVDVDVAARAWRR